MSLVSCVKIKVSVCVSPTRLSNSTSESPQYLILDFNGRCRDSTVTPSSERNQRIPPLLPKSDRIFCHAFGMVRFFFSSLGWFLNLKYKKVFRLGKIRCRARTFEQIFPLKQLKATSFPPTENGSEGFTWQKVSTWSSRHFSKQHSVCTWFCGCCLRDPGPNVNVV